MSYSLTRYPNKEYEFPPPPLWLVWQNYGGQSTGQIRHYPSLQKAKKSIYGYNNNKFSTNWSVYHWNGTKYVEQFSGKVDEPRSNNPLFKMRVKADDKGREIFVDDHEIEAAIESILRS